MHHLRSWRLLLIIAAGAFPTATAQICNAPLGDYGYVFWVHSQSMLDEIAEQCTTVDGSIWMATNYTGSFYLPNVRNITGRFRWENNINDSKDRPTPTSVDLPDLEYSGSSFWLSGLPTLRNVSMPKLKTLAWSMQIDYVHDADFRALETAEYVTIQGNMSTLRLDSLREVRQSLRIYNEDQYDPDIPPPGPLDISLPSLESIGSAVLKGRISSLEVPSLTTITGPQPGYYGLEFSTGGGPPVNLTFPRLSYFRHQMSLTGDIGSLSMPNLRDMSRSFFSLTTSNPLAVNLPFDGAAYIGLSGNISSVQFPNLSYLNSSFILISDLPLDCDSILDTISTAVNATVQPGGRLHCRSATESKHSGLSTGAKVAIGVVVGVVGLAIILGAIFFLKRRRKRQRLATESSVQLQESTYQEVRGEDGDPPPEYAPRSSKVSR